MLLLLALPLGVGLFSIAGAAHYGSEIYKAYVSSRDWRQTQATLVSASVAQDCGGGRYGSRYSLSVIYAYEVEGRTYSSDRIWFGNGLCSGKQEVDSRMSKFPPGASMLAYYDPQQPSQSVLYRGDVENGTLFLFTLLVLLNSGCLWWLAKSFFGAKNRASTTRQIDAYLRSRHHSYDASVHQKADG
jgi:hypothetical protein